MKSFSLIGYLAICALFVSGCRGVDSNDGGGSSDPGFTFGISDGPTEDADEVVITFLGMEFKPANEPSFTVDLNSPASIDLLDYQNGKRYLLFDDYGLDKGTYSWVRLLVDDSNGASYLSVNGVRQPLLLSSNSDNDLQISRGFTIDDSTVVDFTVDFDLRKSIYVDNGGDYILRPSLRVVNNTIANNIIGTVADALVDDPACDDPDYTFFEGKAVYLFEGAGTAAQDIQDDAGVPSDTNPIATTAVYEKADNSGYEFQFSYLEDGDYTVAFTCYSQYDDPTTADDLAVLFSGSANVTLADGNHDELIVE